jgi:hypothetical protein
VLQQRQRVAVILAISVAVGELEQQQRKGALPPGYRMQGRADSLAFPQPLAFPERRAVAASIDPAESDTNPDPGPEQYTNTGCFPGRAAHLVTLELV